MLNILRNLCNCGFLPSCWAIILNFISRVIAFLFFLSEAGGTDGCFIDMIGCKTQSTVSQNPQQDNTRRVLVVYPCDHVTEWELWLAATAQHCVQLVAQEKLKIQNLKYNFY